MMYRIYLVQSAPGQPRATPELRQAAQSSPEQPATIRESPRPNK